MTPAEFSDLVGLSLDVVERYRALGLLDPEEDGLLDDIDLVRLDFVHHRLAQGEFDPESLAAAIREGRVESMYGRRLFEAGSPLELAEAAERSGLEPAQLQELTSALGFSWSGLHESDVGILEILRAARDAGLPWDAILGVTASWVIRSAGLPTPKSASSTSTSTNGSWRRAPRRTRWSNSSPASSRTSLRS